LINVIVNAAISNVISSQILQFITEGIPVTAIGSLVPPLALTAFFLSPYPQLILASP